MRFGVQLLAHIFSLESHYCSCSDQPKKHFPYAVVLLNAPKGDWVTLEPREVAVGLTAFAVRYGTRYCGVDSGEDATVRSRTLATLPISAMRRLWPNSSNVQIGRGPRSLNAGRQDQPAAVVPRTYLKIPHARVDAKTGCNCRVD